MNSSKSTPSFFVIVFFCWLAVFPIITFAAPSFNYTPLEKIPGFETETASGDFYTYIQAVYKFGIWAVGIAALLMITIGGYMYIVSAGNNSSMEKAKGVITDAVIGLVLALTAYLLLYVINPDLVKIKKITSVGTGTTTDAGKPATPPTTGVCDGTSIGCCKANTTCRACSGCTSFSNSYANLCYRSATGNTGCQLNSTLANKLQSATLDSVNAEVSEAWPPSVQHSAACHADGTCADVRCKNQCSNESIANIKRIYDSLQAAGLNVKFEHSSCAPYMSAGINCISPGTMTAPSFHVAI